MPKQFEVKLSAASIILLKQLERELTPQGLNARILSELSKLSSEAVASVQRGMAGEFLATRTGNLRRSIAGRAEQTRLGPAIRVGIFKGPSLAYAGVQEFGTQGFNPSSPFPTIKPKSAKALAIPTDRVKTGAGVSRTAGLGPRAFAGDLVFIPFRKGNIVGGLFLKDEVKAGIKGGAMFLLATQVDLPERAYLAKGFGAYLPTLVNKMGEALARWVVGQ